VWTKHLKTVVSAGLVFLVSFLGLVGAVGVVARGAGGDERQSVLGAGGYDGGGDGGALSERSEDVVPGKRGILREGGRLEVGGPGLSVPRLVQVVGRVVAGVGAHARHTGDLEGWALLGTLGLEPQRLAGGPRLAAVGGRLLSLLVGHFLCGALSRLDHLLGSSIRRASAMTWSSAVLSESLSLTRPLGHAFRHSLTRLADHSRTNGLQSWPPASLLRGPSERWRHRPPVRSIPKLSRWQPHGARELDTFGSAAMDYLYSMFILLSCL